MNNGQRFQKRLCHLAIAGLIGTFGTYASANDFALTNNQFTVSNGLGFSASGTVSINSGVGNVTAISNVPLTSSFNIPNFSFNLASLTANAGTHTFQVGVSIFEPSSNRRLEAFLGTLTLTVSSGGAVTGAIANQNLVVLARAGSLNASAVLTNSTTNGPYTISGGSVTFSGSNLVNRLTNSSLNNNSALFTNILEQFNTGNGSYTYNIVVQQTGTTASSNARFGTVSGSTLTAFTPGSTSVSNSFELSGTVASAAYTVNSQFSSSGANAYRVTGSFTTAAASTGGGGGGTTTPVVDQQTVNQINNSNQELQNAVTSGQITPAVVTQATTTTNQAANAAQTLANAATSGGTLDPASTLTTLTSLTTSASTSSQIAASSSTNTSTQQTLVDSNVRILSGTATAITALANQNAQLSTTQQQTLNTIVSNTLTTLDKVAETPGASLNQLASLATQANSINQAKAALGIPATQQQAEQAAEISRKLALAAATKVLGTTPSAAQLTAAIQNDPKLLQDIVNSSLELPPTATEPASAIQQRIRDAFAARAPAVAQARPVTVRMTVFSTFYRSNGFCPSISQTIAEYLRVAVGVVSVPACSPVTLSSALSDNHNLRAGAQVSAATAASITQDEVTGTLKIELGAEAYTGSTLAIRALPTGTPDGVSFLTDGRALLVRSGVAMELAPVAADGIDFLAAAANAGFAATVRNDSGSFTLDLGNNQRFAGAFAYDNLVGKNLSNCGGMTFAAPTAGSINSANYAFTATCGTSGVVQRILPFPDNTNFFASVAGRGAAATLDRNTGIVTITGVGRFKLGYFVNAPTTAESTFRTANADTQGIAYQGGDFNGDGRLDFKIISESGVQLLYGTN